MKSSDISSASPAATSPNPSPRRSFALTGRSAKLDPRTHAVRPDLADVRLADRIFAPHYAAPCTANLTQATQLKVSKGADSEVLGDLKVGDTFDVLEAAGDMAWGTAPSLGLVGYVPIEALTA